MQIITTINDMQLLSDGIRRHGKKIGFVPTMGALHEGHLSLIRKAKEKADAVVVSVFVNPTQFGEGEDYHRYPRSVERDMNLAEQAGCDIMFVPTEEEMFPKGYKTFVLTEDLPQVLEGIFRPTHFRGVTTVVAKFFNIIKPHLAVFGQKDAQQAVILKKMVADLNFDIEMIIAPTLRESDGLAMSSRNVYLSDTERSEALAISRCIRITEKLYENGERRVIFLKDAMENEFRKSSALSIDYVEIVNAENLEPLLIISEETSTLVAIAARIGKTRLIDSTILQKKSEIQ